MADEHKVVELNIHTEMPAETLQHLECELTLDIKRSILTPSRVKELRKLEPGELLYEDRWAVEIAQMIVKSLQRHRWHVVRLPHRMSGRRSEAPSID